MKTLMMRACSGPSRTSSGLMKLEVYFRISMTFSCCFTSSIEIQRSPKARSPTLSHARNFGSHRSARRAHATRTRGGSLRFTVLQQVQKGRGLRLLAASASLASYGLITHKPHARPVRLMQPADFGAASKPQLAVRVVVCAVGLADGV